MKSLILMSLFAISCCYAGEPVITKIECEKVGIDDSQSSVSFKYQLPDNMNGECSQTSICGFVNGHTQSGSPVDDNPKKSWLILSELFNQLPADQKKTVRQ